MFAQDDAFRRLGKCDSVTKARVVLHAHIVVICEVHTHIHTRAHTHKRTTAHVCVCVSAPCSYICR